MTIDCKKCVHSGKIPGVSSLCCENPGRRKFGLDADYHRTEFIRKHEFCGPNAIQFKARTENNQRPTVQVKATVPQIAFIEVELDMPEKMYEDACFEEMSKYVWDNLTQTERDWCPGGLKGYRDALEVDYSTIRKVQK